MAAVPERPPLLAPPAGRRARVLQVVTRMNVGGVAWMLHALAERHDPTAFEVRIVAGRIEPHEADYLALRAPHLAVGHVEGLQRAIDPAADARALAALVREVRAYRPDVVHTHLSKAGVLGRLAARLCRVPYTVHSFHGHLLEGFAGPAGREALRRVEQALARRTSHLVAEGRRVRDQLLAAGIGRPDQYTVVRPGADVPRVPERRAARRALGLPEDGLVVVHPARLTRVKRSERFVELARRTVARRDDVVFAVAGEGELQDELRRLGAPLGDRFRLLGFRADVENVFAAADVVVMTSDLEGLPVVLVEAALAGRPAVTTDVGSSAEIVLDGATGFVTPPDVDRLDEALARLLDDDGLRRRMGEAAAERAERTFSAARHVADVEGVYRALLGWPPA